MTRSTLTSVSRRARLLILVLVFFTALGAVAWWRASQGNSVPAKQMIVLGIDGMDPELLQRYMQEGKLPNFAKLAASGSFRRLGTSIPPQSPVAWSNLITGTNPGMHGIFDFIHRDPDTLVPYFSTSRVEPPKYTLRLGRWVLPISGGRVSLLRQGKTFWEILDDHGIPVTVLRMPANFPPVESNARTFAGMGTPDLLGTYGTFFFFTDDPHVEAGPVSGGHISSVDVAGGRVDAKLEGPRNPFRQDEPAATVDFAVWLDPQEAAAKIAIQDQEILLREGEWSEWVPLSFELIPYLKSVGGICKFYLKQVRPRFQLYVTPMNLDPSQPALPLSTPKSYARELWKRNGYFYTQGIAEDTQALSSGICTDGEYIEQARMVLDERVRMFDIELGRFREGLFFFYFSTLDQNAHMLWRAMDERHPAYETQLAANYGRVLEELYQEMDRVVGKVLAKLDPHATLLVVSDHGFAPYYRSLNLNAWLLENGYLALEPGTERGESEFPSNVDWSRTRAYGLGLNALYLNLRGRERYGIVEPGAEAQALLAEIASQLTDLRDPLTESPVVAGIHQAGEVYSGPKVQDAPDLVIGYARGYRVGWASVLGGVSRLVLEDNTEPWSGDHCVEPALVPGVLLSNKKIAAESPELRDVAPTILAEFQVAKPENMEGRALFESQSTGPG